MNRQFKYLRLKQGTQAWLEFRQESGIGGSEIASVLATDSKELADLVYQTPIQLHLLKISEPVTQFSGNVASEEGKYQESSIIQRFQYYDLQSPDQMGIYHNMANKMPMNGIYRPNCIIQNPKYPWLFYSMDAMLTESIKSRKPKATIEAKLTTSFESNRYANGVNPAHYLQTMTGLLITGFDIGYLCTLTDGKWFSVTPVERNNEICQWIEHVSAKFWINVVKAKKIKIEYGIPAYYNVSFDVLTEKQQEGVMLLRDLEPSLIGSDNEVKFLREMIIPQAEETPREGTQEEWQYAVKYLKAGEEEKGAKAKKNIHLAEMLASLNGANVINFNEGNDGFYSYKADKNGKPAIYVSPKLKQA